MLLVRAIAGLVSLLWTLVLALLALGVALYCLDGALHLGAARPDRLLHLTAVRRRVGRFLFNVAAHGPTARLALLCGVGAIALGLLLALGLIRGRRSRRAILDNRSEDGWLTARPRALRQIARRLAADAPGVTAVARLSLRLSRRGTRGSLTVQAARSATSDAERVRAAVAERLTAVTEPFGLRARVRVRAGQPGERVQ